MSLGMHAPAVVLRHSNDVLTLTPRSARNGHSAARVADRAGAESMLRSFMNDDGNRLAIMRLCHAVEPGYTVAGAQTPADAARHVAGLIAAGKVYVARQGEVADYVDGVYPYRLRQLAYLSLDAGAVAGSYFLKGQYVLHERTITVTAQGAHSATDAGAARFFAAAWLKIDGEPGEAHALEGSDAGQLAEDGYANLGSATWLLPEVRHGQSVALVISAGYELFTPSGAVSSLPATTEREFRLALH